MRSERWIFGVLAVYFGVVAAIYAWVTYSEGKLEWAGTVALALSAIMAAIITVYLFIAGRKLHRLEDDKDAEIAQGAGTIGFFPPKSIWPLWLAVTISVMCLGPVFGWWLTMVGAGIGIWSLSGLVFEFYRGDYAH